MDILRKNITSIFVENVIKDFTLILIKHNVLKIPVKIKMVISSIVKHMTWIMITWLAKYVKNDYSVSKDGKHCIKLK